MKPLDNIVVLDLSRVLAGPYCTMILADFGAEVIKVEIPGKGDDSRQFGPFVKGESAYFMSINRGKKSITVNLKEKEGQDIIRNLAAKVDVIIENFRPGTMEKFSLGYEDLKKINPKIIYTSSSGFGHTGPYKCKPAYDIIIQGMGGLMSITGPEDGKPTRVGASIADIISGVFSAMGTLFALLSREKTGVGQKVDVSMLDCMFAMLENAGIRFQYNHEIPHPIGNRHPSITPFDTFMSADGYIIIAIGNDHLWEKFCKITGLESLITDPRFKTNQDRTINEKFMKEILNRVLKYKTTEKWIELLEKEGIPCGPLDTIDKVLKNPQILAREMLINVPHPVIGADAMITGIPIKLSETPGKIEKCSPALGEHTRIIFKEMLGYKDQDIDRLYESKII